MNHIFNTAIQKISWRKALLFTALFAIFYVLINFSGMGVARLLEITKDANILDFEFGYSNERAFNMLTAMGTEGREFYLTRVIPLDFPFPFTYMLFYSALIALLIKNSESKNVYKYLLFIPISAMLFDWIENIGIIAMLKCYPDLPAWAVLLSSVFGILKSICTVLSIALIGILFILFICSIKRRK